MINMSFRDIYAFMILVGIMFVGGIVIGVQKVFRMK